RAQRDPDRPGRGVLHRPDQRRAGHSSPGVGRPVPGARGGAASLPALPRQDQGQGRAAGPRGQGEVPRRAGGQSLPTSPTPADYDRLALEWRDELVLPRRHRTTGTVIAAAWEEERPLLRTVPDRLLQAPAVPARSPASSDTSARRLGEHVQTRDLAEYEVAQGVAR